MIIELTALHSNTTISSRIFKATQISGMKD